jgi:hypothetical protein
MTIIEVLLLSTPVGWKMSGTCLLKSRNSRCIKCIVRCFGIHCNSRKLQHQNSRVCFERNIGE